MLNASYSRNNERRTDIASRSYWESINAQRADAHTRQSTGKFRTWLTKPSAREIFYRISDRFFEPDKTKTVLEVGCAPGERLLDFARRYQYVPFGVEYTRVGVEVVRGKFKRDGIAENNCIFSDVFDPAFQQAYKDAFDRVISFGVVEHFSNVDEAIAAHLNVLKPQGKLLIMIPRLRGVYYPLVKSLAPDLIAKHNLTIMQKNTFCRLFQKHNVAQEYCGYYGVLNMGILQGRGPARMMIVKGLQLAQALTNPLWRRCHVFENSLTSPYLLFIGIKGAAAKVEE
ncbi:MAG: methyltransferase domain-containing protein [Candidatus Andersenbacteria bacterium]